MSAPAIIRSHKGADQNRELALPFLRYMATMREVEDRIERKLYRQRANAAPASERKPRR